MLRRGPTVQLGVENYISSTVYEPRIWAEFSVNKTQPHLGTTCLPKSWWTSRADGCVPEFTLTRAQRLEFEKPDEI
jgi:hypothetical protein